MMNPRCALLATVLLAACGSEPSGGAARGAAPDSAGAASTAGQAAVDSPARVPAAPDAAQAIVLAPDGLEVTAGGAPARLAFGGPEAGVLQAVGPVLGEPAEQGIQQECPAGPLYHRSYAAGLQLVFQDGAFVGWSAREGSAFRTAPGIGPGSTLGALKAAYPEATVAENSLGMEFGAGDLFGLVSDSTASGRVEIMFAGINCIFR